MVSIAASQAVDPGSIPGRRNCFFVSNLVRIYTKYLFILTGKCTIGKCTIESVGGIMVSIAASQAVDPGSIPGRRNCFFVSNLVRIYTKYLFILTGKRTIESIGGIMVSIAAFQAVDPGSIPGRRNCFFVSNDKS